MTLESPASPPSKLSARRINVCGTSGSGKTTICRALSDALGIEHTEMDWLHHLPNWQERPREELAELVREVVSRDAWIIDGNYRATLDEHRDKADLIVWLDYSFVTVLIRLVSRTFRRSVMKEELWHGNRETFKKSFFSRDSILVWMVTTHGRRRKQCDEMQKKFAGTSVEFLRFRSPREADAWLSQLK